MAEPFGNCPACRNTGKCAFFTKDQVDKADAAGAFLPGETRITVNMATTGMVVCSRSVFRTEGYRQQMEGMRKLAELHRKKNGRT